MRSRRGLTKLEATLIILLIVVIAIAGISIARRAPPPTPSPSPTPPPKAWELIDWNKPVPWTERLLADEYILPEGWEKATEGVKELVFFNSGSLKHDIATAIGMELFEKKTGIKVKAIEVGSAYTFPKYLSVITAKDPSVHFAFIRAEVEYAHVAKAGWAQNIDVLWPPEVQALYSPGLIDCLNVDGHFYGSVNIVQYYVLFYRPSWLKAAGVEKVPETWEEVYEAAKKCREWAKENLGPDYYGFTFAASVAGHIHIAMLSSLVYSQGGRVLKPDGTWNLDSPEFKNAWNYLVRMVREDIAPPEVFGWGWKEYHTHFGMGKAAMCLGYSVYAVKWAEFPEVADDWAAVPPPKWDETMPDEFRIGYINFDLYVINPYADDRHIAAAMLFLDFYRSKEACMYELVVEGNDAFLPATYEDPGIQTGEKVNWALAREVAKKYGCPEPIEQGITIPEIRAASAKTARIEALPPGAAYVSEILAKYLAKAGLGEMDPEEALKAAIEEAQKYISPGA